MRPLSILSIFLFIFHIGIGVESVSAQSFARIKSETEFKKVIAGKTLWLGKNRVRINRNGTWGGRYDGRRLSGKWSWENGYFCRTIKQQDNHYDCQQWLVDGSRYKVVRNKGRGRSFIYKSR